MAKAAGYSGTPLPKKLGFKDGQKVLFINLPQELNELGGSRDFAQSSFCEWADVKTMGRGFDAIHGFTKSHEELDANLRNLQSQINADGMVWISWPKKASKVLTDVTEDVVRAEALALDLVDVKVCAVDDVWSGLKLVIRKEKRHLYGLESGSTS